jgi:hypothetical protein
MVGRRHRPVDVEGVALIRDRQVEDPAGPQDPDHVAEGPERILAVLEEMIGDDEVLTLIVDRRKALTVVQDVHVHERLGFELGVVAPKLVDRQVVDVSHVRRARNVERVVEGADLDAGAPEIAPGDLTPVPRHRADGLTKSAHNLREPGHPEEE